MQCQSRHNYDVAPNNRSSANGADTKVRQRSSIPIHERLLDRLPLLTVSDVCVILRCHDKTLYWWVKKGSLTAICIGSKLKFDPADVASFIALRRTS